MIEFVRTRLVFIARREMNHAISCVYPHHVQAPLDHGRGQSTLRRFAPHLYHHRQSWIPFPPEANIVSWTLRRRASGPSETIESGAVPRTVLVVSRAGPHSSHSMVQKLKKAMSDQDLLGDPVFRTVALVDDFYGSGTSLIRWSESDNEWKGKLAKARDHLHHLAQSGPAVVVADPDVIVVVYVASEQAEDHIREMLRKFAPTWALIVIQSLPSDLVVRDSDLVELCEWFFDPAMSDEHKGDVPLGYMDAALPVVLHHNTPNNSVSILWADTEDRPDSLRRRAFVSTVRAASRRIGREHLPQSVPCSSIRATTGCSPVHFDVRGRRRRHVA